MRLLQIDGQQITYLIAVMLIVGLSLDGKAADKSGSRDGLVRLPSAGGTVQAEGSRFSVQGNTGSASFRLPLPPLPGRAGVQPELQLSYSQMNGDPASGVGLGWELSVPSIEVDGQYGIPYRTDPMNADWPVNYRLGGRRLIRDPNQANRFHLEASEADIQVIYHAQPYTIPWSHAVDGIQATFEKGFEVIYPDGKRELYSGDANVAEGFDVLISRFPLLFQVMPYGESVYYRWAKVSGRAYLEEVVFAGGQSRYRFSYATTQANVHSYRNGFFQSNGKLLVHIAALFANQIRNQWCLAYLAPGNDNAPTVITSEVCRQVAEVDLLEQQTTQLVVHPRLKKIYRFGSSPTLTNDSVAEPAMRFDYSAWDKQELASRSLVYPIANLSYIDLDPQGFELLDINGDGLQDILQAQNTELPKVYYGTSSLENAYQVEDQLELRRGSAHVSLDLRQDRFQIADINGDGFVDVVELAGSRMYIYLGGNEQQESFQYSGYKRYPGFTEASFKNGAARWVDLNADGKTDVLTTSIDGQGFTQWRIFLNVTEPNGQGGWSYNFVSAEFPFPYQMTTSNILAQTKRYKTFDVNGDQLPDIIEVDENDDRLCVYENNGRFLNEAYNGILLFGHEELHDDVCGHGKRIPLDFPDRPTEYESWFIDVNGDGLKDFATVGDSVDQIFVWYALGNLEFSERMALDLNQEVRPGSLSRSRVGDIDGDAQEEIIVFQPMADSENKVVVIDFNRTPQAQLIKTGLLTVMESDSGWRTDVRYAISTDELTRDMQQNVSTYAMHFPVVVVKQVVESYGAHGSYRKNAQVSEYFYHNPFYDGLSREFKGFEKVEYVVYGDEGLSPETQKSSYVEEEYTAYDTDVVRRLLAGKLKARRIYSLKLNDYALGRIQETVSFDPTDELLHSLSQHTQDQQLPQAEKLLSQEIQHWNIVDNGTCPGTHFIRLDGMENTIYGSNTQQSRTALKSYFYDEHNVMTEKVVDQNSLPGPNGIVLPAVSQVVSYQYDEAREVLADFGILSAPNSVTQHVNGELIDQVVLTYWPENALLKQQQKSVFSHMPDSIQAVIEKVAAGNEERLAQLKTYLSPKEQITEFGYDTYGNRTSQTYQGRLMEEVVFDPSFGVFPVEQRKVFISDRSRDQITSMSYYPNGLLFTFETPLGLASTLTYDDLGRRIQLDLSDGGHQIYRYKQGTDGRPNLILTKTLRYASADETPGGENQWIYRLQAYRADGQKLADVEDAEELGVRILDYKRYNRNQKVVFNWTPYLQQTEAVSTVLALFDSGEIPTPAQAGEVSDLGETYRYDALGRLTFKQLPSGKIDEVTFEPWGETLVETYPAMNGQLKKRYTTKIASALGVVARIDSDLSENIMTTFGRDNSGNLNSILLANEPYPRLFAYNSAGQQEYQKIPGMGEIYQLYNQRGLLAVKLRVAEKQSASQTNVGSESESETVIEPQLITLEYQYDDLDRLIEVKADGNIVRQNAYDRYIAEPTFEQFYRQPLTEVLGQLTSSKSIDTNGLYDYQATYGYDIAGRILGVRVQLGQEEYEEAYDYTIDGVLRKTRGPRGLEGEYRLNAALKLKSIAISGAGLAQKEVVLENVTYNARNQIESMLYRKGASTQISYDPNTLQISRIQSGFTFDDSYYPLQDLNYTPDGEGKILNITDNLTDTFYGAVNRTAEFNYDWRGQLTGAYRYSQSKTYDYDPTGSFTKNTELSGNTMRQLSEITHLIPYGTDDQPFEYDGFGQLISSPKIADAQYDAFGKLIFVHTKNGEQIYFGYDVMGNRTYKQVIDQNGLITNSLFPFDSYSTEPDGERSFVFVGNRRLVRYEHGSEKWFYYLKDHLGSNDILMTADGLPVEQMLYLPFGTESDPRSLNATWSEYLGQNQNNLPSQATYHRFTDKHLDDKTGLYYSQARYYHPKLGRFVTPDFLFFDNPNLCVERPIECGLYNYARNNPMIYVDGTGTLSQIFGMFSWMPSGIVKNVARITQQKRDNYLAQHPNVRFNENGEKMYRYMHPKGFLTKDEISRKSRKNVDLFCVGDECTSHLNRLAGKEYEIILYFPVEKLGGHAGETNSWCLLAKIKSGTTFNRFLFVGATDSTILLGTKSKVFYGEFAVHEYPIKDGAAELARQISADPFSIFKLLPTLKPTEALERKLESQKSGVSK